MAQQIPSSKQGNPKTSSLISAAVIGLVVFVVLFVLLEFASRGEWFEKKIPVRSLGTYHSQFEIKWFKLQDFVKENGGVDVILLGNSMVNTGINPERLASEYEKLTGQKLRIFNFGVEGLTVAPLSDIAGILVETYHPGTILLVTEMRDYVASNGLEVENNLRADEWYRAQLTGKYAPRAWLKSNSLAMQYLLSIRNWSRFDFLDNYLMASRRVADTSSAGYEADRNTGKNIDKSPDPNDPDEKKLFDLFANFNLDSGRLGDLSKIIDFSKFGTTIFVTEMPVYPTYFEYFGDPSIHDQFLENLGGFITSNNGVFIFPLSYELIPLEGRVDNHHLNYQGAPLYSDLLAGQLAEACLVENRCLQPMLETGAAK